MGYQDVAKHGARELADFQGQASRAAEAAVFRLANSVSQLKRLVDQLGTAKDTQALRHKVAEANSSIQAQAKAIKEQLTALHDGVQASGAQGPEHSQPLLPRPDSQAQIKVKKLLQDFTAILQDYKATQKIAADREAASLPRPAPTPAAAQLQQNQMPGAASSSSRATDNAGGSQSVEVGIERAAQLQAQKAAQSQALDNAISYNEALIEERDAGIAEIQRQIGEVNEMFQDLAVLINDQGVQVVTLDEHITATAERVKEGTAQLVKASRSQRSMRSKCLCLWLIAAMIVSVVIILLFA